MTFVRRLFRSFFGYAPIGVAVYVLVMGYSWRRAVLAFLVCACVFYSAAWFEFRRTSTRAQQQVSAAMSRSLAAEKLPSEQEARRAGSIAAVSTVFSSRPHFIVMAPGAQGLWLLVREPARSRRAGVEMWTYPDYHGLTAGLDDLQVRLLPRSKYATRVKEHVRDRLLRYGHAPDTLLLQLPPDDVRGALTVTAPLVAGGPAFAEFRKRVPDAQEAAEMMDRGLGLALFDLPAEHRFLQFLSSLGELRGLWIEGPVYAGPISALTHLRHLSLLSPARDVLHAESLTELRVYEGCLRGREAVLGLPLEQLYLEVADGVLDRVPASVTHLSLDEATNLRTLDVVVSAEDLRELRVSGPTTLDLSRVGEFERLEWLSLSQVSRLTNVRALTGLRSLRHLDVAGVEHIDDPLVLQTLDVEDVIVASDLR